MYKRWVNDFVKDFKKTYWKRIENTHLKYDGRYVGNVFSKYNTEALLEKHSEKILEDILEADDRRKGY